MNELDEVAPLQFVFRNDPDHKVVKQLTPLIEPLSLKGAAKDALDFMPGMFVFFAFYWLGMSILFLIFSAWDMVPTWFIMTFGMFGGPVLLTFAGQLIKKRWNLARTPYKESLRVYAGIGDLPWRVGFYNAQLKLMRGLTKLKFISGNGDETPATGQPESDPLGTQYRIERSQLAGEVEDFQNRFDEACGLDLRRIEYREKCAQLRETEQLLFGKLAGGYDVSDLVLVRETRQKLEEEALVLGLPPPRLTKARRKNINHGF